MSLKNLFILVYFLVSLFYFSTFDGSIEVWLSFFLNLLILTGISYYHLFLEKVYSPFISTYIVFNYLFFIVAPMSQVNTIINDESLTFMHNFPYREELFIKTNLLIALFHVVFFIFYDAMKKYNMKRILRSAPVKIRTTLPLSIIVLSILCVLVLVTNIDFIVYEINRPAWLQSDLSKSSTLIISKVLFILPLGAIIACRAYMHYTNKKVANYLVVLICMLLIFAVLLIVKNPLITKRNDLGPLIFLIIFMFVPRILNTNVKILSFLFFALLVGFPLTQVLTHLDYGYDEIIQNPALLYNQIDKGALTDGYFSLNYDAFVNIGVVIRHVEVNGLSYGFQMLSAFLFFVPRSIWPAKPDASGMIVGDYLIENHSYTFSNLANPFLSEGYLNFGVLGVIMFAMALPLIIIFFMKWLNSNDWFKKAVAFYFAVHLMMILRGDFTNSFAFFVGSVIGIYVIPKGIIYIVDYLFTAEVKQAKRIQN